MKKHSKQFLASLRASRVENELNKVRNDRFIADRLCEYLLNEVSNARLNMNKSQLGCVLEYADLRSLNIPSELQ